MNKKTKGQFYTTNSSYILEGFELSFDNVRCIIEPFAGKGDLINWIQKLKISLPPIEAYDIEPKNSNIQKKDTLIDPPDYTDSWILTNPPYLARNKSKNKEIYDLYNTNDLYKCFISSVVKQNNCKGGLFIIPAGFFFSSRDIDIKCRTDFMTNFKIIKVKYFEETVFNDTTTTVVAFSFIKSKEMLNEQIIEWELLPGKLKKNFKMSAINNWIIGGEIYNLPIPEGIKIRRFVINQELKDNEFQTFITLNALDSGSQEGRISINYKNNYIYQGKECSRTYATFRILGIKLNEDQQKDLCNKFNLFLEEKRKDTWSLFLPQYRESKEYARKRIPFELAYRILLHLIYLNLDYLTN